MLKVISDFGKALEMMSKEIEKVPMGFYWIAGALIFLWLCLYFFHYCVDCAFSMI